MENKETKERNTELEWFSYSIGELGKFAVKIYKIIIVSLYKWYIQYRCYYIMPKHEKEIIFKYHVVLIMD